MTGMVSPHEPMYITIANDLRKRIVDGLLAKGSKLPTERELCDQWKVSGITARAAVDQLRGEGLVETRRGKGVYVRSTTPLVRLSPDRYFRPHTQPTWELESERAGLQVEMRHETTKVVAPSVIADRLGLDEGSAAMCTEYVFLMGGEPTSMSTTWEPYALVGGTDIERPHEGPMANAGVIPRFDSMHLYIDSVYEVVIVRMPTPDEARALKLPPGVPVAAIAQTFRTGDRAVQTSDIVFAGERYELHYRMPIPRVPSVSIGDLGHEDLTLP